MKKIILVFKIIANFFRSKKLIASVFVCVALLFGVSFLSVLGAFTSYFADEPTGALDSESSETVMNLLKDLNDAGKTIIVITHDPIVAEKCRRVIKLADGRIV